MSNSNKDKPRLVIVLNPQAYGLEPRKLGSIVKTKRYILLLADHWQLEDYLDSVGAVLIFNPMTKSAGFVDLSLLITKLKELAMLYEVYSFPVANKRRRQQDYLLVTTQLDDILLEMGLDSRQVALCA